MKWIRDGLAELIGLFAEDGYFALAILACIGAVRLALAYTPVSPNWCGGLLFLGLGAILVESVARRARTP
jgi:hypothetical protein